MQEPIVQTRPCWHGRRRQRFQRDSEGHPKISRDNSVCQCEVFV